jgi:predicted DNA-binding transcriptional regulator YafY
MERKDGKTSAFARRIQVWTMLSESADPLTILEIARRTGVSKNTAQRDLDTLSEAGIPIVEQLVGNANRYSLRRDRRGPLDGRRPGAPEPGDGPNGAGTNGAAPS